MTEWRHPTGEDLCSNRFISLWNIGASITVFLPLIIFTTARISNIENNGDNNNDNNNNNQNNDYDEDIPWWWSWGRGEGPERENHGTLAFVFIWVLGLFIAMVTFGNYVEAQGSLISEASRTLKLVLIAFANLAFLCCVLVAGLGAVKVDDPEVEETGWYGQLSVLLFLTSLFGMVYSIIFSVWTHKRRAQARLLEKENENSDFVFWGTFPNSRQMVDP